MVIHRDESNKILDKFVKLTCQQICVKQLLLSGVLSLVIIGLREARTPRFYIARRIKKCLRKAQRESNHYAVILSQFSGFADCKFYR